jgi:hypothetical protein
VSTYALPVLGNSNEILDRKKSIMGGINFDQPTQFQTKESREEPAEKLPQTQTVPPKFTKFSELKKNITMTNLRRLNSKLIENNDTSSSNLNRDIPQIIIRSDEAEA